ncbi:hypothetical protein NL676_038819 [Syzygium grande]|nr:hypothetical protein NL676_038819 [Syzygium grande]
MAEVAGCCGGSSLRVSKTAVRVPGYGTAVAERRRRSRTKEHERWDLESIEERPPNSSYVIPLSTFSSFLGANSGKNLPLDNGYC